MNTAGVLMSPKFHKHSTYSHKLGEESEDHSWGNYLLKDALFMSFLGFQKNKKGNFDVFVHEFHSTNPFCCFLNLVKLGIIFSLLSNLTCP